MAPRAGTCSSVAPGPPPPSPGPRWQPARPRTPPGSAGGRRTKSGAGGGPAEPQKVVPTKPAPMLFDVASRPPRGGPKPPARERIPLECAAGRPFASRSPPRARQISRGLEAEAVRAPPLPFRLRRGRRQGRGFGRAQEDLRRDSWRRRPVRIPAPLRERKRLNEELRGGSGAPGEEAAGWKQAQASRERRPERRGREGGGGARGALTCPFLSSLSGKLEA